MPPICTSMMQNPTFCFCYAYVYVTREIKAREAKRSSLGQECQKKPVLAPTSGTLYHLPCFFFWVFSISCALYRNSLVFAVILYMQKASKSTEKPLNSSHQNKNDETAISETSRDMGVENTKSEVHPRPSTKVPKRTPKTKFDKFLQLDHTRAEDDLELERKLAKKLKVKGGKLKGEDLGLNMLFEGISSFADEALPSKKYEKNSLRKKRKKDKLLPDDLESEDPNVVATDGAVPSKSSSRKRPKKRKSLEETKDGNNDGGMGIEVSKPMESLEKVPATTPQKYVAPHLRSRARNELEEYSQVRRQLRGLLNRLSESNVESITGDVSVLMRSIPRGIASDIFGEEVLASCAHGPRGNEQLSLLYLMVIHQLTNV